MVSSSLHWNGPEFLTLPEEYWPKSTFSPLPIEELPETKADKATVLQVNKIHPLIEPFHRFSSLIKMQRVLAYCFRFSHRPALAGPLTRAELNYVLTTAVKETQRIYFSNLWKQLTTSQIITPASLAQLAPFIDKDGLIRVGGRLRYSALSEDAKHPILLPHSAHVTQLLIRHYHLSFLHGGPKLVLSMMSHKFWIISGRDAIRRFIFSCVRCSRHRADHPRPFMADLPSSRVQPHRPFLHVGMDYGGPFVIKESRRRNARTSKVYLALFICMSVKAVHLEIVSDLTTDAFLAALDRFVARRGTPAHLYSDCGTNYVGAARQLKAIFKDTAVQERMTAHLPCIWHFNPPAAPHFGGLWEAAIKSTKFHMAHVIGTQILTFEEILTLVTRIEGILNSRPLTPASSDPNDLVPLTPGHFLIGQPLHALPESDVTQIPLNRLDRWQLIRQCHQSFWKRWAKEYLTTLQGRQKWFHQGLNLAVGDMVIVEAPNRPPSEWRLGRVTEVHPGQDKIVRVVTVRTQDGTYKRPVVKLVRLPVDQ